MRTMHLPSYLKFLIICALIAAIAATQFLYDATKVTPSTALPSSITPETVRMLDMGFSPTVASFLWVNTMPEILDFFNHKTEYLSDLSYLTTVDPKFGYPYAFSVLTLPIVPTSTDFNPIIAAQAIGEQGLQNADPDWRIPYYMGTNYYLAEHDMKDAALYFDIAARTPGVPYYAQRFAENFGNEQKDRDRTIALWETIRDTTNDPDSAGAGLYRPSRNFRLPRSGCRAIQVRIWRISDGPQPACCQKYHSRNSAGSVRLHIRHRQKRNRGY